MFLNYRNLGSVAIPDGGEQDQPESGDAEERAQDSNLEKPQRVQAILEARESELSQHLRNHEDLVVEAVPDEMDEACHATERELAIRNLEHISDQLEDVEAALRRIEDGTYGICLHCEGDIGRKRLEAVPWAEFRIRCQEAADRLCAEAPDQEAGGFDGFMAARASVI